MANLNFNGIIRGGVIRNMQVLGFGANPNPNPPGPTPLQVSSSVRFNPADSANISFTPTLQGNRTTFTWSSWVKRSLLASRQMMFAIWPSSRTDSNTITFEFDVNDQIRVAGGLTQWLLTSARFRDPSSWYHVQVAIDTTNATAADRVIVYVNGVRQTTSAYSAPAQYLSTGWGLNGSPHFLGSLDGASLFLGGYLADINFVDGQALTPSSFTETDADTGQLIPLTYTGSYGVNGFYLPFGNSATVAELGFNPKTTGQDYPYWPVNTLLINSSSANGAQNNTFLDSSTNNFTITRNGNTTQGNFTPFNYGGGTTQDNGYYSGYFDGSGDYANVSGSGELVNFGTNNFTIESWFNVSTLSTAFNIFDTCPLSNSSPTNRIIIRVNTSGALQYATFQAVTVLITSSNSVILTNIWNHVALVKSSGSTKLYLNGIQVGSTYTDSLNYPAQANRPILMGDGFNATALGTGYISNLRVVKGTAVYTANFTVPTTPLTAITNTSLLTCQSSQFIDNSANALSIATAGNTQPVPTNPFGMTAWSGYFDGVNDYLTTPSNAAFTLGTGDFTLEAFVYLQGTSPINSAFAEMIFDFRTADTSVAPNLYVGGSPDSNNLVYFVNGANRITSGAAFPTLGWNHVAISRSSGSTRMFINGAQVGSTYTDANNYIGTICTVGGRYAAVSGDYRSWYGYISNARIVKGTALYTANFTPPTAPLTAISGTSLLTCQSSTFVDNSPNAFTITVNGNSSTLTLNNPFNDVFNATPPLQAWSNYFEGTSASVGGGLTYPSSSNFAMGTGDFTIEAWYFPTRAADASTPINIAWYIGTINGANGAGGGVATDQIHYRAGGSSNQISLVTNVTGWNHVAWVRQNGVIYVYLNGFLVASAANTTSISAGTMIVARPGTDTFRFSGYISNMRVVKGRAVYTRNFTPSSTPLGYVDGTVLLTCQSNNFADNSLARAVPTVNTPANISPNSPFFPTTTWSAASYGGTMYFDGTGDYLTVAPIGTMTGDFTYECWIFPVSTAALFLPAQIGSETSGRFYAAINTSRTINLEYFGVGTITLSGATVTANTWNHLAITRSGSTMRGFINGVLAGSTTSLTGTIGNAGSTFIGASGTGTAPINGYISNLRIVNGTALYTTPFVPPVSPFINISNTKLLLNATNANIYDATGENVIETVGNAQVSTAVKKWGASSVAFDGTGDYLLIPSTNAPTQFGSQDFTIEMWIYSTSIGNQQMIFSNRIAASGNTHFDWQIFTSKLYWGTTSTNVCVGVTNLSSNTWYHIAVSRIGTTTRQFINGVLDVSSTTSYTLSGNAVTNIGTNGTYAPTLYPFVGYIQDVRVSKGVGRYSGNFTPPTAAFAYNQYDICNQQWTPTNISVTAGVNQDNLADSPSDYGTDTGLGGQVRGNYATMNALRPSSYGAAILTNGSLNAAQNTTAYVSSTSTVAVSSGKWYWEVTCGVAGFVTSIGITSNPAVNGITAGIVTYHYDGTKYIGATNSAYGAAYTNNDVIGFALDLDAGTLVCYKNGASQGTLTSGLSGTYYAYTTLYGSNNVNFNFGQRAFSYTAPSGFKCLVSTNLPTVNGIGATSSTQATDYFNTVIWTGNGTNPRSITGIGFQPDMVWSKSRSQPYSHGLYDVVRGAGGNKRLYPNETYPENGIAGAEGTAYGSLTSFDSDGFSVNAGTLNNIWFNSNNETYVAWNWKANGAGVANTAGTIPSTVSANTTSGCSIVTYTGTGANATVGHGLGVAPSFITIKQRNGTWSWMTYHANIPVNSYLLLNAIDAAATSRPDVYNGAPSSTVINIGNNATINGSGLTYVAYCFAPVSGFSAMGSYTGNGSTDGPMIFTNFRPAFVLIKQSNTTSNWTLLDDQRLGYNVDNNPLFPNLANAEGTTDLADLLSNGFKIRATDASVNTSAGTYIYAAFAEFPFKYARAR